jgi:hypothetical protein
MPAKRAKQRSNRRARQRGARTSTRGYSTDLPIRVTGRFCQVLMYGDGTTTKGLYNSVTATAQNQIPLSFQSGNVGLFSLDPRLLTMAALYSQWRLREMTLEFVEAKGGTTGYALGVCEDDAANFTNTFTNTVMMETSRVMNVGAIPPQRVTWRPSRNRDWLFVTNASQTTEASRRECSHGNMVGIWDVAPAAATYGYIVVHYDIMFRSEIPSQTVNLTKLVEMNERVSAACLGSTKVSRDEKGSSKGEGGWIYLPKAPEYFSEEKREPAARTATPAVSSLTLPRVVSTTPRVGSVPG